MNVGIYILYKIVGTSVLTISTNDAYAGSPSQLNADFENKNKVILVGREFSLKRSITSGGNRN